MSKNDWVCGSSKDLPVFGSNDEFMAAQAFATISIVSLGLSWLLTIMYVVAPAVAARFKVVQICMGLCIITAIATILTLAVHK